MPAPSAIEVAVSEYLKQQSFKNTKALEAQLEAFPAEAREMIWTLLEMIADAKLDAERQRALAEKLEQVLVTVSARGQGVVITGGNFGEIGQLGASADSAMNISKTGARTMSGQSSSDQAQTWISVVGFACGLLTLVFMMGLVVASMAGHDVPASGRFLVSAVLSTGLALAWGFLGGAAAVKGKLAIPFARSHPVTFSITSGGAIFVISLLVIYWLYARK